MERNDVLKKLTDVFRDVFDDENLTLEETTKKEDVEGWDSLANINLVVSIEDEFGIKFSMESIVGIETVGDLVDVIIRGQ